MHLIFDLDGTLYQTDRSLMTALRGLFNELGLPEPDEKTALSLIGNTMAQFMSGMLPEAYVNDAVTARLHTLERAAVTKSGKAYPGVPAMLCALRDEGHKLSICSNGSEDYIKLVLSVTGMENYFTGIYSASSSCSKADKVRDILLPDECAVVIGDAPDDMTAASDNGISSIGAVYGYGGLDPMRATLIAASPSDITTCVRQLVVFAHIYQRLVAQGKHLIGINGIDTSGKTAFALAFSRYLLQIRRKCLVISIDDFHNPLAVRRCGIDEIDAYYQNAFNYRQLIDEILQPLRVNGRISCDVRCLELDSDRYETIRHYEADEETIVLIEGVLLFRPPISDYMEGKVFLYIDFPEMLKRAYIRDVPRYGEAFMEKYRDKYIPVQKRYLAEYRPMEICDILIDNTDYRNPEIIRSLDTFGT